VTELDLRHSLIPEELIENLLGTMPKHEGPDLLEDRDTPKYDYISFMKKMIDGGSDGAQSGNNNQKHPQNGGVK
jgi:Ca2+ insensitive EF hand